jgi:hypothetical protein
MNKGQVVLGRQKFNSREIVQETSASEVEVSIGNLKIYKSLGVDQFQFMKEENIAF